MEMEPAKVYGSLMLTDRHRVPRVQALVVAALGIAVAGCSPSAEPLPFATYEVISPESGDAEISGLLELRDGCLTVRRYPLALPSGVSWEQDDQTLTYEGSTFAVGDEVSWGGAYSTRSLIEGLPEGCRDGEIAEVHTLS